MKRFEISDIVAGEGVWIYPVENQEEADALTKLPPGSIVIVKDIGKLYVADAKGKLK